MKKLWPLVALGIGAYLVFAIVTLPASVVLSRFAPPSVRAAGVSGTLWKGSAQVLQVGSSNLGGVQWDMHVLSLFTARLTADFKLTRIDGFAQGVATVAPGGRITLQDVSGSLPMSVLPPNVAPGGWAGTLNMRFARLVMENGWPVDAEGNIEVIDLTGPASKPTNLGSFAIKFPAGEAPPPDTLVGALTDLGGPLQITGTAQLKQDRSYVIEGMIATRPDAPPDIVNVLQFLGPPDAQGRRPFSLAGTT